MKTQPPRPLGAALYLLVILALSLAVGSRVATSKANRAVERARRLALEADSIAARRVTDSVALLARGAAAATSSPAAQLSLDAAIHGGPFAIPHDELHQRAIAFRLDSVWRLIRVLPADSGRIAAAGALLETIEPIRRTDSLRAARLRRQVEALSRLLAAGPLRVRSIRAPRVERDPWPRRP